MSIVIVRNENGYIASLRFIDKQFDRELCSDTHWGIYERIERYISSLGGDYASV